MALLTIGAFARAARLSPKALRLYDELGLLRPAAVDPATGYRFYDPAQLDRARLVAWLRRLGMPLADIREVCDLPGPAAAERIGAYWAQVVAETAARGQLASFLVDYLSGKGSSMSDTTPTLGIRYAARTDAGKSRPRNQDTAYAGSRLLAVADGMGADGGERASAAAVEALKSLEDAAVAAGDLLNVLAEAATAAEGAVRDAADGDAGTTLTALVWSGAQLGLVHIGDSRAYVLRDGELFQITTDHTYVQSLVESGQLSADEAASHPQRALLVQALTGTGAIGAPDLSLHEALAGDRYLLCSDGVSAVVPGEALRGALAGGASPDDVADELVRLAYEFGAPDNIACVVADVVTL
ncbi:MerR family transcriptional regulator [Luedemannella helvata]|uniref:MerR family transcriptional regulator n=1 Tax=Luedemannella helvata TaxID=349315 RepID=A0ABN2KA27_9ACTN